MNKRLITFIWCMLCMLLFVSCNKDMVTESIVDDSVSLNISYPSNQGYIYSPNQNNRARTSELTKENGDFIITFKIDATTIGYYFNGDFNAIRNRRSENYEINDVSINDLKGFGYYKSSTDQYIVVLPIDEKRTAEISVEPIERFKSTTGKDIYEREDVNKIINGIKIIKN